MREPQFWHKTNGIGTSLMAWMLTPFAALYAMLVVGRIRLTEPQRTRLPLICVGNFTLGGAGKTPTTIYIAQRLVELGAHPAILLRGFGGSHSRTAMRVMPHHHSNQVGDEAVMLAQYFPTYIGRNRAQSAALAQGEGADILIKDDGFQNPHLVHNYNLLVIDAASGLGNGRVFPAGPLREPLRHAWQRVDAILLIADDTAPHPSLAMLAPNLPYFHGRLTSNTQMPRRAFAFCGIGRPQKFIAPLERAGVLVGKRIFADHHAYSENDARAILDAAQAANATPITSAKDMARLQNMPAKTARATLANTASVIDIALTIEEAETLDVQLKKLIRDHEHRINMAAVPENTPIEMRPR